MDLFPHTMNYTIAAITRTSLGRRAKDEIAQSRIPAVVYGNGVASRSISVERADFGRLLKAAGFSSLVDVTVDGQPSIKALIKDVQIDPVKSTPIHVDFYQVRMDKEITAEIPLKFVGESAAVKGLGGTLIKSIDQIEVRCLPANLPHEIEVDLSALATFEDAITVGSLILPKGVEATIEVTATIATVARPLTEEELKKMEESSVGDVAAIKTEAEEKKAAEEAKKAAEDAAA